MSASISVLDIFSFIILIQFKMVKGAWRVGALGVTISLIERSYTMNSVHRMDDRQIRVLTKAFQMQELQGLGFMLLSFS